MTRTLAAAGMASVSAPPADSGYGRARLWLGMSGVGTVVVASTVALATDLPTRGAEVFGSGVVGQATLLMTFVIVHAVVHLPFDVFGGYVLPRRYGRRHPPRARFVSALGRGVAVQAVVLIAVATLLMVGGRAGGVAGTVVAAAAASMALLALRAPLARAVARFERRGPAAGSHALPTAVVASDDEGFTGGIVGVVRPRGAVAPARWIEALGERGFAIAMRRRAIAASSGAWRRGRIVALVFTWVGVAVSAWIVGSDRLGTAAGVIELGLIFTLWSFLGLLTLPTVSRAGVAEVDRRLVDEGVDADELAGVVQRLDGLQDGEPRRPAVVESIFHPIPSVERRVSGAGSRSIVPGCWDAARTAAYVSVAGLGLLGRAVHCNCGRPGLWVFLPVD